MRRLSRRRSCKTSRHVRRQRGVGDLESMTRERVELHLRRRLEICRMPQREFGLLVSLEGVVEGCGATRARAWERARLNSARPANAFATPRKSTVREIGCVQADTAPRCAAPSRALPGDPLIEIERYARKRRRQELDRPRRELNRIYRQLRLSGQTKLSYSEWLSEQLP
jgi:hypothetical protein